MVERPHACGTVVIDNDVARVTRWRLPPGSAIGFHRHELDYVVVPVTGGELTLREADGTRAAALTAGEPYFRVAGVEHDVLNDTGEEIVFVEVELRSPEQRA